MKKTKSKAPGAAKRTKRSAQQRMVRAPFRVGQMLRCKATGEICTVVSVSREGFAWRHAIVNAGFVYPAGYENYSAL